MISRQSKSLFAVTQVAVLAAAGSAFAATGRVYVADEGPNGVILAAVMATQQFEGETLWHG